MTKLHWIILAIVAVVVAVALIVVLNPHESKTIRTAAGELSHKQETKVEAWRDAEVKAGTDLRAKSERSAAAAAPLIEAGNEAGRKATILRKQTHQKPHAPALPIADTTIIRLQRELSVFGD